MPLNSYLKQIYNFYYLQTIAFYCDLHFLQHTNFFGDWIVN